MIIDREKKVIERFEPYGKSVTRDTELHFAKSLDIVIENTLLKKIGLHDYEYYSPIQWEPLIGIQKKSDAYTGMCITICMIYFHLRMLNPDISPKKILANLLKKPKEILIKIILKYAKYVEGALKDNSNWVNKLNRALHNNNK